MKLAAYITGHGYGHLTRCTEVLRYLARLSPDTEIHVRAPYRRDTVVQMLGFEPASVTSVRLDIGIIQRDAIRADWDETLVRLEYYFGQKGAALVEEEAEWLEAAGIDAAYMDIPVRPFDACRLAGVPAFGIANFSWDYIWADLAEERSHFAVYARRAREAYRTCEKLFRTRMATDLSAFPVIEDVPLVARLSDVDPATVRKALGIDPLKPVVILSYGGEGLSGITFPPEELHKDFQFIITEPMADPGQPFRFISEAEQAELGLRFCDLVHMADVVMSKPGYSTVAECVGNLTAMVYSERKDRFAEYDAIVDYIQQQLPYAYLPSEALYAGQWRSALEAVLEANETFAFGREPVNGAEVVAKKLLSGIESLQPGHVYETGGLSNTFSDG